MPLELLNCCACSLPFNLADRLPKILSTCGHTICLACLNKIINAKNPHRCPVDQSQFSGSSKNIDSFLTNITILQLLEPEIAEDNGVCKEHREANNSVCLEDKCKICRHCAYYGHHKSHPIKHISDVRSETQAKIQRLQDLLVEIENDDKAIGDALGEMPKTMISIVSARFERLKQILEDKFQQIKQEIGLFYALEEIKMQDKLQADIKVKKIVQEKILGLNDATLNEKFFEAFLDEKAEKLFPDTQYRQLMSTTQEITEKLENSLESLGSTISPFIQSFQLKLPVHEPLKLDESIAVHKKENKRLLSLKSFFNFEETNGSLVISPKESSSLDTDISIFERSRKRKVSLGLNRSQPSEIQIEAIQYLWNELDEITELEVDMSNVACSDQELAALCLPYFWSTEKVKRLSLNLFRTQIGDQTLVNILREAASEMVNLKHICLQLGETKLSDKGFQAFPKYMLPSMMNLETFQLDLSYTQVTDHSMEQMCLNLKNMLKNVSIFTLNLSGTKITDKTIQAFTKHTLPVMKGLESFQLYLVGTCVSDSSIKQLFGGVKSVMGKLKAFCIALGGTKITNKSIDTLTQSLVPLMTNLERFELYVGKTEVSDIAIQSLFKTMKSVARSVKSLATGLDTPKIKDKGVEFFIDYLISIKNYLKELTVFLEESQVSDHNKRLVNDIQYEVNSIILLESMKVYK